MKLTGIVSPEMEFHHETKGDALHAMELALSLEVDHTLLIPFTIRLCTFFPSLNSNTCVSS